MKPETHDLLLQAREDLSDARNVMTLALAKVAAPCAYYTEFHAAEAFIYERSKKIAKTHSGVRAEFSRLLGESPEPTWNSARHLMINAAKPADAVKGV